MEKTTQRLSPWITLVTKTFSPPLFETPQTYHSFSQPDYVGILGVTPEGRIPVVRQFRPAIEGLTLELPGGLLEASQTESAEARARQELLEETGWKADGPLECLGTFAADTGRLENRIHFFFSNRLSRQADWQPERGIDALLLDPEGLARKIRDGEFANALHIAILGLAVMYGKLKWTLFETAPSAS